MNYGQRLRIRAVGMGAGSIRAFLFGGLIAVITTGVAAGQTTTRPPVGGVGSPPDAMIFYVAQGAADACGPGCSDWIAAEGTVQFDTNRRLIAILDRQAGRKLPLVIHAWGRSNLGTATKMGRILRDRGIDATAGVTDVGACHDKAEAECFALKRPGGPLDATVKTSDTACDIACVLMLAGAVHRSLPPTTRVILTGMTIFQPPGAQRLRGRARRRDGDVGPAIQGLPSGDGGSNRTDRHHRSQLSVTEGNGTAAVRMAQAWHRHDSAAVTSPPCGIANLPDSQFIVLPRHTICSLVRKEMPAELRRL